MITSDQLMTILDQLINNLDQLQTDVIPCSNILLTAKKLDFSAQMIKKRDSDQRDDDDETGQEELQSLSKYHWASQGALSCCTAWVCRSPQHKSERSPWPTVVTLNSWANPRAIDQAQRLVTRRLWQRDTVLGQELQNNCTCLRRNTNQWSKWSKLANLALSGLTNCPKLKKNIYS